MPTPVTEPDRIADLVVAIARAPLVTFDLEFQSQDRLVPTLCLVQISWLPDHVALDASTPDIVAADPALVLVDPMAVDVRPLIDALAAHPVVVAHAPRQDLGLLATRFGVEMPAVTDTQLMAAFAGIGDQVGLATLANDLLGLHLGKEQQWTNWERRPLSEAQLDYAAADVRHLPAIYALLRDRLGDRMAWVGAESAQVAADAVAASRVTAETAWRQLGGLRHLDPQALAAVIELAAWRHRTAVELDRPLGQVLNDKVLLDVARQRPSVAALRAIKGMSPIAKQRVDALAAALAAARPTDVPALPPSRASSQRAQRWGELLVAIVGLVADRTGIAARLLATRADADEFARTFDADGLAACEPLPALATWRREVIGQTWVDWLEGRAALLGDPTSPLGLRLGTLST